MAKLKCKPFKVLPNTTMNFIKVPHASLRIDVSQCTWNNLNKYFLTCMISRNFYPGTNNLVVKAASDYSCAFNCPSVNSNAEHALKYIIQSCWFENNIPNSLKG